MWNDKPMARLRVASLKELDALVGKYLTGERPQTYWEEEHAAIRFDSIHEALEALHDPYFRTFLPSNAHAYVALTEVQEFRSYSSDLTLAWEMVEQLATLETLRVRRDKTRWIASFGDAPSAAARSAPVAICLAALLVRGIDVQVEPERAEFEIVSKRAVA